MITRNGNFRIEEKKAHGYDIFSNSPDLKILARNQYGHGFHTGTILAVEYFGKVYVFSAEYDAVRDDHGEFLIVNGRSYGTVWRDLKLDGSARKHQHALPNLNIDNPLFQSKEIKDDLEYAQLTRLALEFFSDFKFAASSPSVRQIKFHKDERFTPKLVEVSENV